MAATRLDGKALALQVREEVAARVKGLVAKGVTPGLAVVLVGDDPASQVYVRNKAVAAEKAGVRAFDFKLPATATEDEVLAVVDDLNHRSDVDGVLVQLPLPSHIDASKVQDAIDPTKDVDGLHADNLGLLAQGRPRYVAATPKGCMRILQLADENCAGKSAVVIGRSNMVGKPMAMLLTNAHATVTLCHSRTVDLGARVASADIVVAAVGRENMIRGQWIKPGAVVIDVGINRNAAGKLVGDVEYAVACERARAITPVPGGVGPMTIASLLENTVDAAVLRRA